MQATGRQPQRAPDGNPFPYERHRPEQTTLYRWVQQHVASSVAHIEANTGAEPPWFVEEEFASFLECGILAHLALTLRCGACGHDKLLAFGCKRRGLCPSCGARRTSQTAAPLVDHAMVHVRVRQRVLSPPIPLRVLLAAQPELVTPVLQVVQRVVTHEPAVHPHGIVKSMRVKLCAAQALAHPRRAGSKSHHKACATPRPLGIAHRAAQALQQLPHHRQANAAAAGPGAEEGREDLLLQPLGHAGAVVRHGDAQPSAARQLSLDGELG